MKKQPLHSVFDLPWESRSVIEASAGTGKTYTIVGIFIRLLIEKKLTVDQILVMTFTKKATAELRERIFDRLRECLKLLENGYSGKDSFLAEFKTRIEDKDSAIKLLKYAIRDFDDAQVTTIHGFCQKVLREESLLTQTPFDVDVLQEDTLLKEATEDFWRQFIHRNDHSEAGKYYVHKLFGLAKSPKELRDLLSDLFSKPYAVIEGEGLKNPVRYLKGLLDLRNQMRELWIDDKPAIINELLNSDIKGFTERNVNSRVNSMEDFLHDELFLQDDFKQLTYFTTDYFEDEANLKKNGVKLPSHKFFDLCSEYDRMIGQIKKVETGLIKEAFNEIKIRREKLSIRSESVTYDDLLIKVDNALTSSGSEGELAVKLRSKYPFVLVDEFQDTDPVQYSIFDRIYPAKNIDSVYGLFMIGDPKQAIYGFRGADIYTYFKAVTETGGTTYTLQNNFRSSPRLVEAINKLFLKSEHSFIQREIEFFTSSAGTPELADKCLIDGKSPVPFQIIAKKGIESNKDASRTFAIRQTVTQIVELLKKSEAGEVTIGNDKLRASDIAVLVSGHKDAAKIKSTLKEAGIDSVTYSRENVFDTFEASRVEWLMTALLDPFDNRNANRALMSGFFGNHLFRLFEQKENESQRRVYIQELQDLHDIWVNDGFLPMFRALLYTYNGLSELAMTEDSERVLTNLYQLADITSKVEKEDNFDPYALHQWFLNEMADFDKDDEKTLLLESDQNLVKISTIHNSKGLEFPFVFCPMLWEGREQKKQLFEQYHIENSHELCININQQEEDESRKFASKRRMLESVAEEVRKTYVALTRAKYFCSIIWDTHSTSHVSGLGSLLIGSQKVNQIIKNNYNRIKDDDGPVSSSLFINQFVELGESYPSLFHVHTTDDSSNPAERIEWDKKSMHKQYVKSKYKGRYELTVKNRLSSFSSLSGHKNEAGEPDYDEQIEMYAEAFLSNDSVGQGLTIFNFPRGATAGTAIHKIFEHQNFDFADAEKNTLKTVISDVLTQYGFDSRWEPVLYQMLHNVIQAKIPGLHLNKVHPKDQLREMEFHFSSVLPGVEDLLKTIRGSRLAEGANGVNTAFMTGFIDLIVRQNGVYYIVDYKSNYLGDSIEDYQQERLADEIKVSKYDLQYHIYIVALIKYLRKRISGFNYEKHFGGAAYLFVRGMREGRSEGVWFHKPRKQVIDNLEELLG